MGLSLLLNRPVCQISQNPDINLRVKSLSEIHLWWSPKISVLDLPFLLLLLKLSISLKINKLRHCLNSLNLSLTLLRWLLINKKVFLAPAQPFFMVISQCLHTRALEGVMYKVIIIIMQLTARLMQLRSDSMPRENKSPRATNLSNLSLPLKVLYLMSLKHQSPKRNGFTKRINFF